MAKSPMTLPSIGAPAKVELQIDSPPELKIPTTPEVKTVPLRDEIPTIRITEKTISVPFLENSFVGYSKDKKRADIKMTIEQATALKSIQLALESMDAKLENGKCVSSPSDALKWILESAIA